MLALFSGGGMGHKELRSHLKPFYDDFESVFGAIASIFDGVSGEDIDSDNGSDDGGEASDNGEADAEGVCSEDEENESDWEDIDDEDEEGDEELVDEETEYGYAAL